MNRTSLMVTLVLVGGFATMSQAGWHHRHSAYYQAAPAYYMPAYAPMYAPAYAPSYAPMAAPSASSAQSALGDIIIAKLVDKLIGSIDKVDIGNIKKETNNGGATASGDISALQQELRDLKASIKDLDARVENANSALQVHGTHLLAIQARLEGLKGDLDVSSDVGKAAQKILQNAKSLGEIEAALMKPEFKAAADVYKAPAAGTTPEKAISDLRAAVQGLLKP